MIETLGLEDQPIALLLLAAGAALGLLFGVAAQISRFCLRRAVVGDAEERPSAASVWAAALLTAILGAQALAAFGLLSFEETRFAADTLPLLAIALGGLMFGAGMTLSGGCASRLTVLGASGNLRAVLVMLVFAVVALATLRGALAPAAVWLRDVSAVEGAGGFLTRFLEIEHSALILSALAALGLGAIVLTGRARPRDLILGAVIGLTVAGGWAATGFVLADEFDPRPAESLAFTASSAETLFYAVAGTAIEPSFGVGVILGVIVGAHLSARARGELAWRSFSSPSETLRYLSGGALMGVGGVLAGGCTIGAGLTGISTLSVGSVIALLAIIAGAKLTRLTALRPAAQPQPA